MIDEDIANATLDAAQGKGSLMLAEVRLEESNKRQLSVKSGDVSNVTAATDSGMYVRIVLPTGIGFASSNLISRDEGKRLVARAYSQAKSAKRKTLLSLAPESPVRTSWEVRGREHFSSVSTDEKLRFIRDIDEAVIKTKVKVQGRYYDLSDYEISSHFANSEGTRLRSVLPRVKLSAVNMVSAEGQTEQSIREWGASGGWEKTSEWNLQTVLPDEVLMLKKQIEKGKKVPVGTYDLVCGPEVVGIASHESCGHPMEGDRIQGREMSQAGRSFVSPEMIGQEIGSKYVTVIDDPTVPGTYGYYAYDHEGVKARPRYLYKDGKINEFLHNRETASRMGLKSNGSSRSESYIREPIVRMANTFVAPGDYEDDELVGSIKNGVLMQSFTEWNIDDKRYNQKYVSREAYFIKDGELAGPARKCILEITTPGFWKAVDAVSKKVEFEAAECGKGDPMQGIAVCTGGPMIRLRGVVLK